MRVSYELLLRNGDGRDRSELIACETPQEAMEAARSRLEEEDLHSVEVRQGGVLLFTMSR